MVSKEAFWGRELQNYVSGTLILARWLLTCYGVKVQLLKESIRALGCVQPKGDQPLLLQDKHPTRAMVRLKTSKMHS